MIDPSQCRAGRALLGWSLAHLAKKTGLGKNTVSRFENGLDTYASTVTKIQAALEAAGVVFLAADNGGPGVRLKKRS